MSADNAAAARKAKLRTAIEAQAKSVHGDGPGFAHHVAIESERADVFERIATALETLVAALRTRNPAQD